LRNAIQATFARRATLIPVEMPLALSAEFATDTMKQQQWKAFLSKNGLHAPELGEIVVVLQQLVGVEGLAA
jgi:hypothetical protein